MAKVSDQTVKNEVQSSASYLSHKIHNFFKGLIIVAIALIFILIAIFFIVKIVSIIEVAGFEGYLKARYSKEFKVESTRVDSVMIGDLGRLIGIAHPLDDKNLVFKVIKDRDTWAFSDDYVGALWSKEERPVIASFLKTIYREKGVPDFVLNTHIYTNVANPIQGKIPNINDAMIKYRDNFFYDINLRLSVDHELSQVEIKSHNSKIKQISDFILSKNIPSSSISYNINIKDQNASYSCGLFGVKLTDQDSVNNCLKYEIRKAW